MLYISTDVFIPEMDTPYLSVKSHKKEEWMAKVFTKEFIYFVGAYEGCSCGFSFGINPVHNGYDLNDENNGRASVKRLISFLLSTSKLTDIEFYNIWSESENDAPLEIYTIKANDIAKLLPCHSFEIREKVIFLIPKLEI